MDFERLEADRSAAQKERLKEVERESAGHRAEREAFGEVNGDGYERHVRQEIKKLGEGSHENEIMFNIYRDAVKENQPFKDPTDPSEKRFPSDLHAKVVELLKLDRYEQLGFYTAVGSDLDRVYGTDAFLELDLGKGMTIDVTLDITLKPEDAAKEKYKADVILPSWEKIQYENDKPEDSEDAKKQKKADRKRWDERTAGFAGIIAGIFEEKAKEKGLRIKALSEEEIKDSKEQSKTGLKKAIKKEGAVHFAREQRLLSRQKRKQTA